MSLLSMSERSFTFKVFSVLSAQWPPVKETARVVRKLLSVYVYTSFALVFKPRAYKTFSMLHSAEHEILNAH